MFVVYVLQSVKNLQLYIGQTNNFERRMKQHNTGKVLSTKAYLPYRLIYKEAFVDRPKAVLREKELKSSQGRRFLKNFTF